MTTKVEARLKFSKTVLQLLFVFCSVSVLGCGTTQCPVCPKLIDVVASEPTTVESVEVPPAPEEIISSDTQTVDEAGVLTRLLTAPSIDPDWFNKEYQEKVPLATVKKNLLFARSELGAVRSVKKIKDKYQVRFENGGMMFALRLDNDGRISRLWYNTPMFESASFSNLKGILRGLEGKVSVLAIDNEGNDLFSILPEEPLAVGSAFKLAILNALYERLGEKKGKWKKTVVLKEKHKSIPTGSLHNWPEDSELTLSTLANLMISSADITATDVLLDWIGRRQVENHAKRNKPFLSAREAYTLKGDKALGERYVRADEKRRRKILEEIASMPRPEIGNMSKEPSSEFEWLFTARELCKSIETLAHLPAMQINPGFAKVRDFDQVAYIGGSKPGIRNYTTWVKKGERSACVTATWNDSKPVDTRIIVTTYRALLVATRNQLEK